MGKPLDKAMKLLNFGSCANLVQRKVLRKAVRDFDPLSTSQTLPPHATTTPLESAQTAARKVRKSLNFVAEEQRTLTELANASGIPKSSVHRLLNELLEQNLLTQNNKHYRLGVKLLELGEKVKRQLQVPQVAEERMRAAARRTGETLHLGVLGQRDIVYLAKVDGGRSLQMASYIRLRSPAQTTAMGKVLIAALPEGEWSRLFQPSVPRTRLLSSGLTSPKIKRTMRSYGTNHDCASREDTKPLELYGKDAG